jgi:type I restriction enzyme, S subunit
MTEWIDTTLGEIVELKRGYDLPQRERILGDIPIFSSAGPTGWHNKAMVKAPGVVTGRYGTLGEIYYVDQDYWPLNTTLYVKDFKGNDPKFIAYYLRTMDFLAFSDKAAVPGLNRNDLHTAAVHIPKTRRAQESITSVLSALDEKIALLLEFNATLESACRLIFKDWFIDFGPTRAKMTGQAPYLALDIWSLFADEFEDDGRPVGWSQSYIGDEIEVTGGSTPSTTVPEYWGGEIAWATPKDLSLLTAPVLLNTERRITEAGLTQIGSGLLPAGTVLLSSRAPIGYLAVTQIPCAINQGFIAMRCNKRVSKHFAWLWTNAHMDTIKQKANGSTFQEISKSSFRTIPILLPSDALLSAFEAVIAPLFDQILSNEKESRDLAETRDFLLPKLMSGELRVSSSA